MDVKNPTAADGLALTKAIIEGWFAVFSGHQITAQDLALNFQWPIDLPLGGFGLQSAASINGTFIDARFVLDGDDSAAIQAAIDKVAATSEGKGIVYLAPRATPWTIDATISVPSDIWIMGSPGTKLKMATSAYAFALQTNTSRIRFSDLWLDGDARITGLVDAPAGSYNDIQILRCRMGDPAAPTTTYADGYLFRCAAAIPIRCTIADCELYGGGAFMKATGAGTTGVDNRIVRNRLQSPGGNSNSLVTVELTDRPRTLIAENYVYGHSGVDRFLRLVTCDDSDVRDNISLGGRLSPVVIDDCDRLSFIGNKILNGCTATFADDDEHALMQIVNNPKGINIDRNAITCVDAISGTIPVNAGFNFRIPGTLSGRITNNIFSMFNDGSTTPPAGEFRVRKWPFKGGFVGVAGSPTAGVLYTGNLYFVGQRVWKSLTGGAGSEVVTTTGRTIEFDFTNYRWRLSQDGNAHTPQIIVFQGGGGNWLNPNQVTIGCSANITAGIEVVVEMDG